MKPALRVLALLLVPFLAASACAPATPRPVAAPPLPRSLEPPTPEPPLPAGPPAMAPEAGSGGPLAADQVLGASWDRVPTGSHWSSRDGHASAVFRDRLWVLGGWDVGGLSDVWSSADGADWRQEIPAPWPRRKAHASVVFRDRLWVLGGSLGVSQAADVWSSADGAEWRQETAAAPWGRRNNHAAVVFGDRLWVLGGWGPGAAPAVGDDEAAGRDLDDVWWSDDGTTWQRATEHAGWSPRNGHAAAVFGGKLWVLGGWGLRPDGSPGNLDDTWWSDDGITWHRAVGTAPWTPRNGHAAIAFAGRLWVLGGWGRTNLGNGNTGDGNLSDVWWTEDGSVWHPATSQASWLPRNGHTLEVFHHRLYLIGGWSSHAGRTGLNDLWFTPEIPAGGSAVGGR